MNRADSKFLKHFPIAKDGSMENAKLALRPLRPSSFLVSANLPGLGTSTLVKKFLSPFTENPCCTPWPTSDAAMHQAIFEAAFYRGYLWFDHPPLRPRKKYGRFPFPKIPAPLLAFLTSRRITGRFPRTTEMYEFPNNVITFISGNCLAYSPDLAARCRVINLWAGEPVERSFLSAK